MPHGTPDGSPPSASSANGGDARRRDSLDRYWSSNKRLMLVLLLVWAVVGLGCGILLADWLNQWSVGGAPLGFWMAQQGSIVVFVVLILIYALLMNGLDRKHHDELAELEKTQSSNDTNSDISSGSGEGGAA